MKITKGYKPCQYPGCTCQAYGRLSVIKYCPTHKKIVAVEQSKQSRQRIKEYNEAKKRVRNDKPKICGICGNEFVPKTANQIYCGKPCYYKAKKQQFRERTRIRGRICPICGKEIDNPTTYQIYHKGKCKSIAANRSREARCGFGPKKTVRKEIEKPNVTVDDMCKIMSVVWQKHRITIQYGELSKYTDAEKMELLNGRRPWK